MTDSLDRLRTEQQEWLQGITDRTGKTLTEISRLAGFSPSTLTRFANNRSGHRGALSSLTIKRVAEVTGSAAPETLLPPGAHPPADVEAIPFKPREPLGLELDEILARHPELEAWRLKTKLLAAAGYCYDDVVVLDRGMVATDKDIVAVEVTTRGVLEPQLQWRVFDRPYIISRPLGEAPVKPRLVDGDTVRIVGVVCGMFRGRLGDKRD